MPPVTLRVALGAAPWMLAFALAAKLLFTWDKLPDEVASHFGLSGEPNAWMSREGFGAVTLVACLVMALLNSPLPGRGFERVPLTILAGIDAAMLMVVIAFWQAIDFNAKGKRLRLRWIFAPLVIFLLFLLLAKLPGR